VDEDLKRKLTKILALTQSPNEAEATAAAGHLHRLLTKHNLDIADLEHRGQSSRPTIRQENHDLGKAAFKWKLDLAEGIAAFYYCHPLVDRDAKTVAFLGRPDNVQSLQMLYTWIIDQIRRIAKEERRAHYDRTGEHIDPLRWQIHFGVGCVERLVERLVEMKAREEEDAIYEAASQGSSTALMVMSDERTREISDYLESIGHQRIDGRPTKRDIERRERWAAEEKRLAELKERDIEAFYAECPWERPLTPEQEAKQKADNDAYLKREAARERKNAARRKGPAYRERRVDWNQVEQSDTARESGRANADKVNLRPFLTGATDTRKIK
jgi:hypothetical protein